MTVYSIRDLEKLTGIKKHTIRIWEQRYRLITPARTDTNIRYYTDDNLRHLFNIALLNKHGFKISKLAKMQPEEITGRVAAIAEKNNNPNAQIDALTLSMLNLDESGFDRVFSAYEQENGFARAMSDLVYPLLENLKALWITRSVSPAHEKFISHLIRRKLMCAIDAEAPDGLAIRRQENVFLLYLPEGEAQELTLLFMSYLLRHRSHRVVYLGSGTSLNDIGDASGAVRPDFIFTIIDAPLTRQSVQHYVDQLAQAASGAKVLLTGAQLFVTPVKLPSNVTVLNGLPDTMRFLDSLEARKR